MLTSKRTALKSVLESKNGIHLTAYLVNRGDIVDLKSQLLAIIYETEEWLNSAMSAEERKKFLEPLDSLLEDARIFQQMKGNIGLFRNNDSFRVLNVPVEVEQSCFVATSFHVKPLLRWLQADRDFLLLALGADAAHLYLGSQETFKLVGSIVQAELLIRQEKAHSWLEEWLQQLTKHSKPRLFLVGEKSQVQSFSSQVKYPRANMTAIAKTIDELNISELCISIRKVLKEESKKSLEKALAEFRFAEEDKRTKRNIFQISKAVVEGRVRKLLVTDELSIFGKIDMKSGGLEIHPCHLDHEDDDILDDLAQMVLSQGGEVIVAKRDEIPKGRPILAILEDDEEELVKTDDLKHFEVLEERFG